MISDCPFLSIESGDVSYQKGPERDLSIDFQAPTLWFKVFPKNVTNFFGCWQAGAARIINHNPYFAIV
jgi:hypothetical protein